MKNLLNYKYLPIFSIISYLFEMELTKNEVHHMYDCDHLKVYQSFVGHDLVFQENLNLKDLLIFVFLCPIIIYRAWPASMIIYDFTLLVTYYLYIFKA